MSLPDLLSLILDNLSRRKGRVMLTAVGVVIGTTAIIILVSLGAGLQRDARDRFGAVGDLTLIQVWPGFDMPGPGAEPTQALITSQTVADISAIPGVASVTEENAAGAAWKRLALTPDDQGRGLAEKVGEVAQAHGAAIRELRQETPTLERVFLDLISRGDEETGP